MKDTKPHNLTSPNNHANSASAPHATNSISVLDSTPLESSPLESTPLDSSADSTMDSTSLHAFIESATSESVLARFIQECLEITHNTPTKQAISKTRYALSYANALNVETERLLETLESKQDEPLTIAIVGQFSSGKSTFLNALLGRAILPSGITPITSKVCSICYGDEYGLLVSYTDGTQTHKPLEFLHSLDELENLHIASFTLCAPVPLLRHIRLLDTPGFNSQNAIDTETTNAILESVDGIIWLSLIDNVGKQSELDILHAHIRQYAAKSLCVLNQKDRLKNEQEVQTSLEYAKTAFSGIFSDVIAISAKLALQESTQDTNAESNSSQTRTNATQSNIHAVKEFLTTHIVHNAHIVKEQRLMRSLRKLLLQALWQNRLESNRYTRYKRILEQFAGAMRFNALQSGLEKQFSALFTRYDNALENLSQAIFAKLESAEFELPITSKGFLGISSRITQSHTAIIIPKDSILSAMTQDDNKLMREFRTLGFSMSGFGAACAEFIYKELESLSSDTKELIDTHIHHTITTQLFVESTRILTKLQSELDSLKTLITLDYTNAITLAVTTLDSKIQYALHKHKQNPKTFAPFSPTFENIRDGLNHALHFLTFQDKLSLHNALYKKTLWELTQTYIHIHEQALTTLAPIQESLESKKRTLHNALQSVKALSI